MNWFGSRPAHSFHFPPRQNGNDGKNEQYERLLDPAFLARLEKLRLLARRRFDGGRRAERRSRRTGASLEFADHRSYTAGDDLRNVDWNIYGRLDKLFLKLFEEEEDLPVHLLLDVSASMQWVAPSSGRPSKLGLARQIAAALTYIGLAGLDRVNIQYFSSELGPSLGVGRGRARFHRACEFLARQPESAGATDLSRSLQAFGRRTKQRGLAIVLSDFFDPQGYETALGFLLYQGYEVQLVHLLDPADLHPRLTGDLRLTDPESAQAYELTVNETLAREYKREIGSFLDGLERYCRRRGIGYRRASTDVRPEDFMLRELRAGGAGLVR